MKTAKFPSLVSVLFVFAVIGLLLLLTRANKQIGQVEKSPKNPARDIISTDNLATGPMSSNAALKIKNNTTGSTLSHTNLDEPFKVITDVQSGQYAAVTLDMQNVISRDLSGKIIWSNNIVAAARDFAQASKLLFYGRVSSMVLASNALSVQIGTIYVELDKRSGEIISFAAR